MLPSKDLLLFFLLIPNISTQSTPDTITDPKKRVEIALSRLQSWYDTDTGIWKTTGWWNAANVMTMLGNLAQAEPDNKPLRTLATNVFANTLLRAPAKNPQPGIEDVAARGQSDETIPPFKATGLETGYSKHLDPLTYEPHTIYPAKWDPSDAPHADTLQPPPDANAQELLTTASRNPSDWLDGFYDDNLWWALAWITAYNTTAHTPYLSLAEGIFAAVARTWPTHCGAGGIYWSSKREYVNAIANELFLSTAAHLANLAGSATQKAWYVGWAERSLTWFLDTGMLNERGTINDGLDGACRNNGRPTWSYNQGVILGALVELSIASPSKSATYLSLASRIAKAALFELADEEGVIHDVCEPACGNDGTQFKGIFVRNLIRLHQVAPDVAFREALRVNAESIWRKDRNVDVLSVNWAGPFVRPGNASTQSAAMDALVAAVAVV